MSQNPPLPAPLAFQAPGETSAPSAPVPAPAAPVAPADATPTPPAPPAPPKGNSPVARWEVPADDPLDATLARRAELKEQEKAIKAEIEELTNKVKYQGGQRLPDGSTEMVIAGTTGPALKLSYREGRRVNTPRLQDKYPDIYLECSTETAEWRLDPVKG